MIGIKIWIASLKGGASEKLVGVQCHCACSSALIVFPTSHRDSAMDICRVSILSCSCKNANTALATGLRLVIIRNSR